MTRFCSPRTPPDPPRTRRPLDAAAALAAFAAMRQEGGEDVRFDPGRSVAQAWVSCSAMAMRRMLANLTDNAIRYGGAARIGLMVLPGAAEITVDDDGPGVPAEDLARLLKPFERLEASRHRATGGAGLGLAIVKALAESAGGDFRVENRPSGGLRATVRLSAASPPSPG